MTKTELYKNGLISINNYHFYPLGLDITSLSLVGVLVPCTLGTFGNTNTKTYLTSPTRDNAGSISNINDIDTFETPRLQMNFDIMDLTTWRYLKLATKPNEFLVTMYDWEYDSIVTNKMYFATQDEIDIFQKFGSMQDYYILSKKSIDIVGTNNSIKTLTVTYNANGGTGTVSSESVSPNEPFQFSDGTGLTRNYYVLVNWNTEVNSEGQGIGLSFPLGLWTTTSQTLNLYAIWSPTTDRTLSFDYQSVNRQELDTETDSDWITSKTVTFNAKVGTLPAPKFYLTQESALVEVGTLIGWWNIPYDWKTYGQGHQQYLYDLGAVDLSGNPISSSAIKQYTSTTDYKVDGNSTIYAHWSPEEYTLKFESDGGSSVADIKQTYGSALTLPTPTKSGYTFVGWYEDIDLPNSFTSVTMIAESKTLYAKWE